jgi:hypothetical protein
MPMTTTLTGIEPIPVEYILGIAQTKATQAQRRPYVELIERWGDEQGCVDEARRLLRCLRDGQEIDPQKMPREFMPRFRQPEVASQLIEIVRQIDEVIASKQENWTWAHVMRVMKDEGILYNPSINRFDAIICSMVPGKGRDTVRKHGDYEYIMRQESPWTLWPSASYLNPTLAAARSICNQIALLFAPLLNRTIRAEL